VLELSLHREDGAIPYRRTFTQPISAPALSISVGRVADREIPVTVRLDRPGLVRLRAVLERARGGRRRSRPIAERVVRIPHPGARRVKLRVNRAGRMLLRRRGRAQLTVTARYRSPSGRVTVRRVRRLLRRAAK
jgi:hypothetical protein